MVIFFSVAPHWGGIYEDCTVVALITLESSPHSSQASESSEESHALPQGLAPACGYEKETGSVVSTVTRGYNHCWLFFSRSNTCSFNRESLCLAVQNKWLGLFQDPDSWFGVLGLNQGKLIVSSACFIDIILFIYLFCFQVLAFLSSILSTAPCPLLSSPPRSRK